MFSISSLLLYTRPVSSGVKNIAIGAGGLRLDSRAGEIRRSVAYGSPPLRRFFGVVPCAAQVLKRGNGPRHSLQFRRDTATIMKM